MNSFNLIFEPLELQYGIDIDDEDAIDIGLMAWRKIGSKNLRLYRYRGEVKNGLVELPCNLQDGEDIEAVTYDFEDFLYTDNMNIHGGIESAFVEHYIEGHKVLKDSFYIRGRYVKYDKGPRVLYIHDRIPYVNILYKGTLVDDDGLPLISAKEAEAIAAYIAMTVKFKEGWKTNNLQTLQLAQLAELKWKALCSQARVRTLNLNDMNEILDAKSSWNRKLYGKSLKPIR